MIKKKKIIDKTRKKIKFLSKNANNNLSYF